MSSDPIEVLRTLRDRYSHNRHAVLALDAAIASLSAPKPESAEAVATVIGYGSDSGDVVEWHREDIAPGTKLYTAPPRPEASVPFGECCDTPSYCSSVRRCTAKDTSPQQASAPVGVEGFEQWYARVDARFWNNWDACNAAFHAGKRSALAQQPAAEPYKALFVAAMNTAEQAMDYVQNNPDKFDARPGDDKLAIICREFLKAQQPAAVDGALDRLRREGYPRLWRADLVGGQISVVRMREILTAALAGQQQGGPQE